MRDLVNKINPKVLLAPTAAVKATVATGSVNTTGYDSVAFEVNMGIAGDTLSGTVYFEIDVQDSPDNSVWTAVADQYVQYAVGTANGAAVVGAMSLLKVSNAAAQILKAGYLGQQPYVRLNFVVTGTHTNGTDFSATAILSDARHQPAGATQTP